MNNERIPDSEFIINDDGSAFHIHVKPEQLTDNIIVCGDPARVTMISMASAVPTMASPSWRCLMASVPTTSTS